MKTAKLIILTICLNLVYTYSFSQSKAELQNFIVTDLKKSASSWTLTMDGKLMHTYNNFNFSFSNCDLIITTNLTTDGIIWNKMKWIVPVKDIVNVRIIYEGAKGKLYSTTRLVIESSGHSMARYCDGKLLDFDDQVMIGLGISDVEIDKKYITLFQKLSKSCN